VKKQAKEISQVLPLDAAFVNKSAVQSTWAPLAFQVKHFTLKRRTKAAVQRVELLQKCTVFILADLL